MSGLDSEDFHVTGARGWWSLNINKRSAGLGTHQIRCYKSEQAVLLTDVGVSFTSLAAQKCPSEAAGGNGQVEHWNTDLYILILNLTVEHGSTNNFKSTFCSLLKEKYMFYERLFHIGSKQLFPTLGNGSFFAFDFQTLLLNSDRKGPFQPTFSMKITLLTGLTVWNV